MDSKIIEPEISIIVPVYKVEKYLERCINSVLIQTFDNFELILVDDGSPDKCGEICDKYAKLDSRIKVIHKKNGGLSSARNVGLDVAKGKYIGFVDSDDYINKYMFQKLYENIIQNNADISMCDYEEIVKDTIVIYKENKNTKKLVLNSIEALENIYKEKGWIYVIACNKLYKKSIFDNLRFPVGKIHEDEMIAHEILYKANKIVFEDEKLYYYLQHDNSIMGKSYNIKRLDIIDAMRERAEFFYKKNLMQLQYKAEYEYLKTFFKLYYKFIYNGPEWDLRFKSLKKGYNSIFFRVLKNPQYNFKEKVMLFVFYISPNMYGRFIK
mgnify:CR=1 FL=1